MKKKKKRVASSKSASKASASKSSLKAKSTEQVEAKTAEIDPLKATFELCELSAAELAKLPAEVKQQVFYGLLVKGEMLMKEQKNDEAMEYFLKALNIVPNPAEVIKAYEQTLPADMYSQIIKSLQAENRAKTEAYFQLLAPESGLIKFEEVEGPKVALTGKSSGKLWTAVAAEDIEEEAILMSEEADIALSMQPEVCDYCFKSFQEEDAKLALDDLSFCSAVCRDRAVNSYAGNLRGLTGTAAYAYQQLLNVVQETKSFAPVLMLRYVAALLEDELRKQKSDSDSPAIGLFSHYDYLRPAYRAPRDADKAEAMLIRTILAEKNADVGEFLTDEIYVAMKSTVMFNSVGFITLKPEDLIVQKTEESQESIEANDLQDLNTEAQDLQESNMTEDAEQESTKSGETTQESNETENSKNSDTNEVEVAMNGISISKSEEEKTPLPTKRALEPIRYAGSTTRAQFFGLYHTLAHVAHSCEPNCRLISDPQVPRRLKLVSDRSIKNGEKLTISFLPADFVGDRKSTISSDFYIICECSKCS